MRVVDFLILLLEAQAQTLQRLAALFGEEALLEMLEQVGEQEDAAPNPAGLELLPHLPLMFEPPRHTGESYPYSELEGSVQEFKLSPVLEFHLWAYPFYRLMIESSIDLNSTLKSGPSQEAQHSGVRLIEEAVDQAKQWIRKFPIPPALAKQAERAAEIPWLRFRTHALKRAGRRPLGPVY